MYDRAGLLVWTDRAHSGFSVGHGFRSSNSSVIRERFCFFLDWRRGVLGDAKPAQQQQWYRRPWDVKKPPASFYRRLGEAERHVVSALTSCGNCSGRCMATGCVLLIWPCNPVSLPGAECLLSYLSIMLWPLRTQLWLLL